MTSLMNSRWNIVNGIEKGVAQQDEGEPLSTQRGKKRGLKKEKTREPRNKVKKI